MPNLSLRSLYIHFKSRAINFRVADTRLIVQIPVVYTMSEFSSSLTSTTMLAIKYNSKPNAMFYDSHSNIFQLLEATSDVQTTPYVKMNSANMRNFRLNKKTVGKEKFLQRKMIQFR